MKLVDDLKSLVNQFEEIQSLQKSESQKAKKMVDNVETTILPPLQDEFDKLLNLSSTKEETIDEISDLFTDVHCMISDMYDKFSLIPTEENDDEFDLEDDCDVENDAEDDDYVRVLKGVSKSALIKIGMEDFDSNDLDIMMRILLGIVDDENDGNIVGKAIAEYALAGYMLPEKQIIEMCQKTRENCEMQILGLKIAINTLQTYNCSAEQVLSQISQFLS